MGRNNKNLKYQMMKKLDSLDRTKTSKYKEQKKNKELGRGYKSDYIHSVRTMTLYKDEAARFADWLKSSGFSYKTLSDIPRSVIADYLTSERSGGSAWTAHLAMSAMNKLFNQNFTTRELGFKSRRIDDIKNNRGFAKRDRPYLQQKYANEIHFLKACGCRRSTVSSVNYNSFVRDSNGKIEAVETVEKGGKHHYYYVLPEHSEWLTSYVDSFYSNHSFETVLFDNFDKSNHLNTHWFRNEYSVNLYNQLVSESESNKPFFNGSGYSEYAIKYDKIEDNLEKHGHEYKGYDTVILSLISQSLSHYRLDVCVNHYLRG